MTNIFLSYSSKDKDLARRIAEDLKSHSVKVWFDEWEIHVGHSISQMIERGLEKADFVAVLLTKHSVNSGWVEKEWQAKIGEEAAKRKVIILPLSGEKCHIPALLRDKRYADFVKDYQSGIDELFKAIEAHSRQKFPDQSSKAALPVERTAKLAIGSIPIPCFFPSVSGAAKNSLSPLEHLKIVMALRYPHFLISAYDIFHATRKDRLDIHILLEKAASQGQVVLMDSGLYEKKRLRARSWPKENFYGTLRNTTCHLAFCYDNPNPKGSTDQIALDVKRAVTMDQKKGDMKAINPLIHAQYPADFPLICSRIAERLNPALIGVPERELGEGVLAIAQTVRSIREALNETGQYYPVHIVGTGNPLSILIYAACGADSFDGIDWCQTVVDHATARLYHSLQLDFFTHQTPYGSDPKLSYLARAFAHNLVFYLKWVEKIRRSIEEGSIAEMITRFIPLKTLPKLQELLSNNGRSKTRRGSGARK
jgi:queuine/archaeosine tRNA-ribosyltransferase